MQQKIGSSRHFSSLAVSSNIEKKFNAEQDQMIMEEILECYDIVLNVFGLLDSHLCDQRDPVGFERSQNRLRAVHYFE